MKFQLKKWIFFRLKKFNIFFYILEQLFSKIKMEQAHLLRNVLNISRDGSR